MVNCLPAWHLPGLLMLGKNQRLRTKKATGIKLTNRCVILCLIDISFAGGVANNCAGGGAELSWRKSSPHLTQGFGSSHMNELQSSLVLSEVVCCTCAVWWRQWHGDLMWHQASLSRTISCLGFPAGGSTNAFEDGKTKADVHLWSLALMVLPFHRILLITEQEVQAKSLRLRWIAPEAVCCQMFRRFWPNGSLVSSELEPAEKKVDHWRFTVLPD